MPGELIHPAPERVLVVDDEPLMRNLFCRWLMAEGYQCITAGNATAAWTELQRNEIHLVTLDVTMPGRSGLELLERISLELPDIAVIMLSARSDADTAIAALTQGAGAYLVKPVECEELVAQVRNGLERRRLILDKRQYTRDLERRVFEQTCEIRRAHEETIHRLVAATSFRDEETGAHVRRTGLYSEELARAVGWSDDAADRLRMAAPMHDIGKIGIPDAILRKPGKLTPAEFEVMKTHTVIGAQMLAGSESPVLRMAQEIALRHHERWDGSGYPGGLAGSDIPQAARIVGIVDAFDALTHDRVYRGALAEADALAILLEGQGTLFDPQLLDAFMDIVPLLTWISWKHPDGQRHAHIAGEMPTPTAAGLPASAY